MLVKCSHCVLQKEKISETGKKIKDKTSGVWNVMFQSCRHFYGTGAESMYVSELFSSVVSL